MQSQWFSEQTNNMFQYFRSTKQIPTELSKLAFYIVSLALTFFVQQSSFSLCNSLVRVGWTKAPFE